MMTRDEIIGELSLYFDLSELVCPDVLKKYGERAWQFFDTALLHTLLVVRRDILKVPLYANDGVSYTQRGLRCNLCELNRTKTDSRNLYMSAHSLGKAVDMESPKMTAQQMRDKIAEKADLLPYNVRIERDVSWLHIDTYDAGNGEKITYFNG